MLIENLDEKVSLIDIIQTELVPYVKKIDQEAHYAKNYLMKLGEEGYFSSGNMPKENVIQKRIILIEETAKVCMTTAFCLWCQFAAITYIENSDNEKLRQKFLPKLTVGELLAGTGLSNPLKSFSNIEKLHLKAEKVSNGFIVNGALPAVSNICDDHAFAFIASSEQDGTIMGFVPCNVDGMKLKQRTGYLALNGSATYSCSFQNVFLPDENIISLNAQEFVQSIRTLFVSYQIPLGFGVTASCIESMKKIADKNKKVHQYLRIQPTDIEVQYEHLRKRLCKQIRSKCNDWNEIVQLRLAVVDLTLLAVQANMIHSGGAGYLQSSSASRKLREAYFLVNLTPTVKHLELLKHS